MQKSWLLFLFFLSACNGSRDNGTQDLTGIWEGQTTNAAMSRTFETMRRHDGRFFSKHMDLIEGEWIEVEVQYGFWGQTNDHFWTKLAFYCEGNNCGKSDGCDFDKHNYKLQGLTDEVMKYVAIATGNEYQAKRISKDTSRRFHKDRNKQLWAEDELERFARQCNL